ncbi:hypothetical protein WDU94_010772 [Cyamophila willieti]
MHRGIHIRNDDLHRDLKIETVKDCMKRSALSHQKRLEEHPNPETVPLLRVEELTRRLKLFFSVPCRVITTMSQQESAPLGGLRRAWAFSANDEPNIPGTPLQDGFLRRSIKLLRKNLPSPSKIVFKTAPVNSQVPPPTEDPSFGHRILVSRLSDPATFARLRSYLAYFEKHRDACLLNGDSYVTIRSRLESSGLPLNTPSLRSVYFDYLRFREMTDDEIEDDLQRAAVVLRHKYGLLPGKYSIPFAYNAPPHIDAPRIVPFKIKNKVKQELDSMLQKGIIAQVNEPCKYIGSAVYVEKPDSSIREM